MSLKTKMCSIVLAFASLSAVAETYYWVPDGNTWAEFSDLSNWRIGSADGAEATVLPGTNDTLAANRHMRFDLGGETHKVKAWYAIDGWTGYNLYVTNGVLRFMGGKIANNQYEGVNIRNGVITVCDGATLEFARDSYYLPGNNDSGKRVLTVEKGGKLLFDGSEINWHNGDIIVKEGAEAEIRSRWFQASAAIDRGNEIINNGLLYLPDGLLFEPQWHTKLRFYQKAGTLTLGGDIVMRQVRQNANFSVEFRGGTVVATDDVAFDVTSVAVPSNSVVTLDVAEGKILDFSNVAVDETAELTKTGLGYLGVSPNILANLTISAGGIALTSEGEYDLSSLSLLDTATILVGKKVQTITGLPVNENVKFVFDPATTLHNLPFITASDSNIRARLKEDLEAFIGSNYRIVEEGLSLVLESISEFTFDSTATSDLSDPKGWACGYVPENEAVFIRGEGVRAEVVDEMPSFASITIANGASLTIKSGEINLPEVKLILNANLSFEGGTNTMYNGFSSLATPDELPTVTIETNATVKITQSADLSNIDLKIFGTIDQTEKSNLLIGTAKSGERTYLKLLMDGANIKIAHDGLKIACPEKGGAVEVLEPMLMKDFQFTITNGWLGLKFGLNNPTNIPMELVWKNAYLIDNGYMTGRFNTSLRSRRSPAMRLLTEISGGAIWRLQEGVIVEPIYNSRGDSSGVTITKRGQMFVENGAVYNQYHTKGGTKLEPDEECFPSLVISEGGIMQMGHCKGNTNGVYRLDGGTIRLVYSESWGEWVDQGWTPLFGGAKAIEIPEGKTGIIAGFVNEWRAHNKYLTNNVPFIGAGNLVITNASPSKQFTFFQKAITNTITGTLTVADAEKLQFILANGAQWGGVVNAKNVEIDRTKGIFETFENKNEGPVLFQDDAVVTNYFGGLNLDADWSVKVLADGTSDYLGIGEAGFSGENNLLFSEDVNYQSLPRLTFGSAPSSLSSLPKENVKGYSIALDKQEDNPEMADLILKKVGFAVIIK